LEAIPGKLSIDSLQKSAVLGTSHIIWNILQSETGNLSGWFRRSTREGRHIIITIIIIIILLLSRRHPFDNTYFPVRQNTYPLRPW